MTASMKMFHFSAATCLKLRALQQAGVVLYELACDVLQSGWGRQSQRIERNKTQQAPAAADPAHRQHMSDSGVGQARARCLRSREKP
eukprot:6819256-Pyramimonas_sp.AAC.2